MNFRRNIGLISLFLLLLPFVVPLSIYLLTMGSFGKGKVLDIEGVPGFIAEDLEIILTSEDPMNEKVSGIILGVMVDEEGFIYIHPDFKELQGISAEDRHKESVTQLTELTGESAIGITAFSLEKRTAVVFFRFPSKNPLKFFKENHSFYFFLFLILFLVIPVGLSTFFLISLRKALSALESGARNISEGMMEFNIDIPKDKALGPVFSAFDNMRLQLIESNAQKSRFLMSISHDLKTPLTSIKGYLEVLEDGIAETEEERQKYLKIIRDKSSLLEERIVQLIEFTRMETLNWQRNFAEINIHTVLKELLDLFYQEALVAGRMFSFTLNIDPTTIIMGDQQMLHRAFENLMDNAFRYTQKEDPIFWDVKQTENSVVLTISDSGPGIEEDSPENIFEPFYRGSRGRNEKGFGLGLSSVNSIIDAHGGGIKVGRSKSGGAEFVIVLPTVTAG